MVSETGAGKPTRSGVGLLREGDAMKVLIILLAGLLAVVLWLRHDNANLSRSFEKANRVTNEQKTTIGMLKISLPYRSASP